MALTDSLVSYWKLDEASGDATDSHGSNTLTDNNTVGSTTGKINNGRLFTNGNTEYFSHADNADLSTGDIDFSFSAWIKPASFTNYWSIVDKWTDANNEYLIWNEATNSKLNWIVKSSGGVSTNIEWATALSANTWYFVVVWHDSVNNVIGMSIDDATPQTAAHTLGVFDGGSSFWLGRGGGGGDYDGVMDEVGFWKRVLTSGERTQLYNSGAGLAYPFVSGPRMLASLGVGT